MFSPDLKDGDQTAQSQYLYQFFGCSDDAFFEFDSELRCVFVNPVGAALLRRSPADLIGTGLGYQGEDLYQARSHVLITTAVRQVFQTATPLKLHQELGGESENCLYEVAYTPILEEEQVVRVFALGRACCVKPVEPVVNPDQQQVETLSNSVTLLQTVLDHVPQFVFWKDRNSVYQGCNRKWAEVAGLSSPEQAIGKTDADLPWTPAETMFYRECDRRIMESDTPEYHILESQRQADGRDTWRETSKIPLHDADGNVIGILGMIEDITERKLAEDLLRQSAARFRKLAQREELLNHLSNQIRNSLDLRTILQTAVREVRQLLNTDRVVVYQFFENWAGEVVVEDVIPPWLSVLGEINQDDCFPKQYAQLYRQRRVRTINNVLESGLGNCHIQFLQRLQVQANLVVPILMGKTLWGLLIAHECRGPRNWQKWEINLLQQLADQLAIAITQAELYTRAHESAQQAQAQAQQLEQALQELQETQTQLIQTEKMSSLGQLVAGVAHEINNPVNFIYGNLTHAGQYTQDLLHLLHLYQQHYSEPTPEICTAAAQIDLDFVISDLPKTLASMKVGADRIRQIVLSLRNFSRLDEAEKKPVNIHDGLESTLLILQNRLKTKLAHDNIELTKNYGNLPLVECYAGQLNQVFMNILSNALDALEEHVRGASLPADYRAEISITTAALPPDRVVIRIADNGPGIPLHLQQRLFDPFFTTKPIGAGTGLGLSISHQIVVEKHGGILKCNSTLGQGTEFWIEIPICQKCCTPQ